jgi:hypothetical protein
MLALLVVGMLAGSPVHVVSADHMARALEIQAKTSTETLRTFPGPCHASPWVYPAILLGHASDGWGTNVQLARDPGIREHAPFAGDRPSPGRVWRDKAVVAGVHLVTVIILDVTGHCRDAEAFASLAVIPAGAGVGNAIGAW